MKKKYRIKNDMKLFRDAGMSESEADSIIGFTFENDYSKEEFCHNQIVLNEWMCEEITEFKEGDLVLVKDGKVWDTTPRHFLMQVEDGDYLVWKSNGLLGSVGLWDEIKPYTKETTALEDLIEFKEKLPFLGDEGKEMLDAIIEKMKK